MISREGFEKIMKTQKPKILTESDIGSIGREIHGYTLEQILAEQPLGTTVDVYDEKTEKHAAGTPDEIRATFSNYLNKNPFFIEFFDCGVAVTFIAD